MFTYCLSKVITLAGKIPEETKKAIMRAYGKGGKSKAQLAREYEVSVTSVTRIILDGEGKGKKPMAKGGRASPELREKPSGSQGTSITTNEGHPKSVPESELERALSSYGNILGEQNAESLVREFVSWISRRDKGEKELISLEMAIESLKLEKSSIENEISRLGSKAGSLEILIGKMKKLAEDSQIDLSLVEERLANIEEKLAIDHDILLIGSALRMILRGEQVDDELVAMIADISNLNLKESNEMKETVRQALSEYSDFFRRRIRTI